MQEKFAANSNFFTKTITDLKFKASYAEVGNPLLAYNYLSVYRARPYAFLNGSAVAVVGNKDLKGEKSVKYDFGMELGLFNRVNITADVFKNDINDQVLAVPTPFSAGIPGNNILQNIGKIRNNGIELNVDLAVVRSKDFGWNINANYTYSTNKIISLYKVGGIAVTSVPKGNYNIDSVGQAIGSIYGYEFAGVNSGNGNPVYYNASHQLVQRDVASGSYFFANSLSDPTYGTSTSLSAADKKILGSAIPTYFGGFTNNFNYKGFGLEVFFRYQGGNKIMNITRQEILLNQKFANSGADLLNRWTTPGQITDIPKLYYAGDVNVNQNGDAISRFVEDGKFIKLQTITLSYQIHSDMLQTITKNSVKSARFFVQVQNAQTWTKYRGIDPEAFSELGLDNGLSPQVRTFSMGVNLGL